MTLLLPAYLGAEGPSLNGHCWETILPSFSPSVCLTHMLQKAMYGWEYTASLAFLANALFRLNVTHSNSFLEKNLQVFFLFLIGKGSHFFGFIGMVSLY